MRAIGFIPVLLLLAGCATSSFAPAGGPPLPPWEGDVVVLSTMPSEDSYRLLGVVTVDGVQLTSDESMYDALKASAAAQGADAVVLQATIRDLLDGEERRLAAYAIRRR